MSRTRLICPAVSALSVDPVNAALSTFVRPCPVDGYCPDNHEKNQRSALVRFVLDNHGAAFGGPDHRREKVSPVGGNLSRSGPRPAPRHVRTTGQTPSKNRVSCCDASKRHRLVNQYAGRRPEEPDMGPVIGGRVLPAQSSHTGNSHPVTSKCLIFLFNFTFGLLLLLPKRQSDGWPLHLRKKVKHMFAKHSLGGFTAQITGPSGASQIRAEGTPTDTSKNGTVRDMPAGLPSARHLAQMRLATNKAGLNAEFADIMAETGVNATQADDVAAALADVQRMMAPFGANGSARMDNTAVMAVARRAVMGACGSTSVSSETIRAEIGRIAGEEAASMMAASEPLGRSMAMTDHSMPNNVTRADAMADGLLARMQADHIPTHGREFVNMRLDDMARQSQAGGNYLAGRPRPAMHGAMGSDDFSAALAIASNKVLLTAYEAAESQIKKASRQVNAPDFRPINSVRVSGGVELDKVAGNGEFTAGEITDAGEAFAIDTYGKIFYLTRQAIVNDDLGAFQQSASMFGQGAALTEARIFARMLEMNAGAGPIMRNGKHLFHADHRNLADVGMPLSIEALSAARTAMRRQKGLAGEAVQVNPAFLIVPPELETVSQQLMKEIAAANFSDVNPFQGTLSVLVDASLDDPRAWYIAAMPGRPEGLQHAYLDGASGPQIFTREGFETDTHEFKVRLDFGAGFVDHRAWYKNTGFNSAD